MKTKSRKIVLNLLIIIIVGTLFYSNNVLTTSSYNISSNKIPKEFDGFKILQLSDLHKKEFGENNKKLVRKINKISPDIIVITGDMQNSYDENDDVFLKIIEQIHNKYSIYYVLGNHEQIFFNSHLEKLDDLKKALKEYGVHFLDNEKETVKIGQSSINIYGMWINLRYYRDKNEPYSNDIIFDKSTVTKILGSCNNKSFNILLTHNPIYFKAYADWNADLILTGHTHGGIIRLPIYGGLLSPEREFFPEYSAGLFKENDKYMIVNRGLGNGNVGIRLFNPPDLSVITLKSK